MNVGVWLSLIVYLVFQLVLIVLTETCAQHYLEVSSSEATLTTIYLTQQPAQKVIATSKNDQPLSSPIY